MVPDYCRESGCCRRSLMVSRAPSMLSAMRFFSTFEDETGVYKNLLQETAHRAGLKLPVYTTVRSGPGHQPIFTCSVELAGMSFNGELAKTKKQAEKNAAMAAWSALKKMPNLDALQPREVDGGEEHEQAVVASVLSNFKPEESMPMRQRDQQQRRTLASPHNALGFGRQWRLNDRLMDGSSIYQSHQPERWRGFSAPAPPIGTKIAPPVSSVARSPNVQECPSSSKISSSSSSKFPILLPSTRPVASTLVESWKKDQMVSTPPQGFGPRPSYQRAIPLPHQRRLQTHPPFSPPPHARTGSLSGSPVPRAMTAGGFRGIAPAVHVRSVVPVCAAPSPMMPPPNTSGDQRKGSEVEISATTSKIDMLQL